MAWVMAAVAVVGAVMNFFGAKSAAEAQAIIARAQIDANKMIRESNNILEATNAAVANTVTSLQNKRILDAAGEQFNVTSQNMVRLADQATKGTFAQRLAAAEQMGSSIAAAASAGIGGMAVEQIQSTMINQQAIREEEARQHYEYQRDDTKKSRDNIMVNAVASMDNSFHMANLDRTIDVMPHIEKPSLIGALVEGFTNAAPYIQAGIGDMQMKRDLKKQQAAGNTKSFNNTKTDTAFGVKSFTVQPVNYV